MKSKLVVAIALAVGTLSSAALAEEPAKAPPAPRGKIMLDGLIITLRPPRPVAAVDVARVTPKLTLTELRQPLIGRIEAAIEKDPF
ncbi:MAG: hypothetical protein ABJE95_06465 [Byssovorax sp.]